MSKKIKALVQTTIREESQYYERQISAIFENGGGLYIAARGENIADVIQTVLALTAHVKFNLDHTIDFTMGYWHLTEDLEKLDITVYANCVEDYKTHPQLIVRRLAREARDKLLKKMARHNITLRGEKGEL